MNSPILDIVPRRLFITPYYDDPERSELERMQLTLDSWACYDAAVAGNYDRTLEIILSWMSCLECVNDEAKLVMLIKGQLFLEAFLLLPKALQEDTTTAFEFWLKHVYHKCVSRFWKASNNRGAWAILGFALECKVFDLRLSNYRWNMFISQATNSNGKLWIEAKRTNSGMWYSYYTLAPLLRASQLLTVNKYMLRPALDWLFFYVKNPDLWPFKPQRGPIGWLQRWWHPCADFREDPQPRGWPHNLYHVAGKMFKRDDWLQWGGEPPYEGVNIFRHG